MASFHALKKALWPAVGFAVASTALMGFAHTKPGRPLLALMAMGKKPAVESNESKGAACPLGFSKVDPSQKDAALHQQADQLRGTQRAWAKPALGFSLEKTTRADIEAWAKQNQLVCRNSRFMSDFECSDVSAGLLSREPTEGVNPDARVVKFTFDSQERLVSLMAVRYDRDPNTLASFYTGLVSALSTKAGPASKSEGEPNPQYLSVGPFKKASATFAFNDYYAKTWLSQIREGEFMFVEEYRSLPN